MYRVAHHDQTVKGRIAFFFPVIIMRVRSIAGLRVGDHPNGSERDHVVNRERVRNCKVSVNNDGRRFLALTLDLNAPNLAGKFKGERKLLFRKPMHAHLHKKCIRLAGAGQAACKKYYSRNKMRAKHYCGNRPPEGPGSSADDIFRANSPPSPPDVSGAIV